MEEPGPSPWLSAEQRERLRDLEIDLDRSLREAIRVRDALAALRREWAAEPPAASDVPATSPPSVAGPPNPPLTTASPATWLATSVATAVGPGAPMAAAAPPPWWQREGALARVLSVVGAAVLLIGVSLLLVLAIQRGYFGPVPRVATGSVVSIFLVVLGALVYRRQPGNPGAIALAATGVGGGYLVVVAVTAIYDWVALGVGLLVAAAVFAVGLVLARRWTARCSRSSSSSG